MKQTFSRTRLPFFLTPLGLILPTVVGVVQAQADQALLYLKTHPDLEEGVAVAVVAVAVAASVLLTSVEML